MLLPVSMAADKRVVLGQLGGMAWGCTNDISTIQMLPEQQWKEICGLHRLEEDMQAVRTDGCNDGQEPTSVFRSVFSKADECGR